MHWKCPYQNETCEPCLEERRAIQQLLSFWLSGSRCNRHFEFLMNLTSSWTWSTGQWHWVKLSAMQRRRENFSVSTKLLRYRVSSAISELITNIWPQRKSGFKSGGGGGERVPSCKVIRAVKKSIRITENGNCSRHIFCFNMTLNSCLMLGGTWRTSAKFWDF